MADVQTWPEGEGKPPGQCGTQSCRMPAAYRVHWPGQTIDLCPECRRRAAEIAKALEFGLCIEVLP